MRLIVFFPSPALIVRFTAISLSRGPALCASPYITTSSSRASRHSPDIDVCVFPRELRNLSDFMKNNTSLVLSGSVCLGLFGSVYF